MESFILLGSGALLHVGLAVTVSAILSLLYSSCVQAQPSRTLSAASFSFLPDKNRVYMVGQKTCLDCCPPGLGFKPLLNH